MSLERLQLTPQFVQAVRDVVDLCDVAGEHTQLKKNGQRYLGLCPFHKEKTPSFSVDPERGLYYCFGCGAGGDAIRLHMQLTGDDFPAAMEALGRRYGIPLPKVIRRQGAQKRETNVEAALEAAARFFRSQLSPGSPAQLYLEKRAIGDSLRDHWGLGFAPDRWDGLLEALRGEIPLADLEAAGLVARSEKTGRHFDRFRNRLMFPIRNPAGALVGFGGRTLGDDRAKYINSSETDRFQKGHLLYGLDLARRHIREAGRVLLVEGYFDVLGAAASGVEWGVASMGTALTRQQVRLLARYTDEVILGYDGDRAGEEACRKALPLLLAEGLNVRRAAFPAGQDPDSLRLEEGVEAVRQVVEGAEDAVLREIARHPRELDREPRLQAQVAAELRELLSAIPDTVLRYSYGRRVAERLRVPLEVLWQKKSAVRELEPPSTAHGQDVPNNCEARCLQLLVETQPSEWPLELPPPAAFQDPECRSIYEALRAGDRSSESSSETPSRVRAVLEQLPSAGGAVDRLARLLLQEAVQSWPGELAEQLQKLTRRLERQQHEDLAERVRAAQRENDPELLRLAYERHELVRRRHGISKRGDD